MLLCAKDVYSDLYPGPDVFFSQGCKASLAFCVLR